ncbi:MAG: hypothetical protein ACREBG_16540 [Pyrinomonadaceae bacterium]
MLTEEEKKHIYLQEIYRHEVKQELEKQLPKKVERKGIWDVINSIFFLWFMSTVVIGTASFFYTRWEKQREENRRLYELGQVINREKEATIKKLDTEISSRLISFARNYYAHDYMDVMPTTYPELSIVTVQKVLKEDLRILDRPTEADIPINIFPEFANRNLQSLIWELSQIVPPDQRQELEEAYRTAKWLPFAVTNLKSKSSESPDSITADVLLKKLGLFRLDLDRWGIPFELNV